MEIIYRVVHKIFEDKEDALRYENALRENLPLRAGNLKVYYERMKGYPGIDTAIKLINNFCEYHKFGFGPWKGEYIAKAIMSCPSYISELLETNPAFKLNKAETALWEAPKVSSRYTISYSVKTQDEIRYGEEPDYKLIAWEEEQLRRMKLKKNNDSTRIN